MKWSIAVTRFSPEESRFLKGIAILMIVLHNYYRWIPPITGENEFYFNTGYILRSWIFLRTNPLDIVHVFFNFLGHYGVQAFIVISAYGLTLSWRNKNTGYGRYLAHRFDKLYPSLVLAGFVFVLFTLIFTGSLPLPEQWKELGIQLTLFANLVPGKAMAISGPWWFYSFIFGFYIVFPVMMWIVRRFSWPGLVGMTILGYLFAILLYKPMTAVQLNPYMFFLGHMPELCLGIFLALKPDLRIPWWILLIALLLVAGGNCWAWLWPFANLGVAILLITGIQWLMRRKDKMKLFYNLMTGIGSVSMYLFACHGFMRSPFMNLANKLESPVASLLIGLLFVLFATGIAYLMRQTEQAGRDWIRDPASRFHRTGRLFLLILLLGGSLWFIVHTDSRHHANQAESFREEVRLKSSTSFEEPVEGRWDVYTDTLAYEGSRSLVLFGDHAFSPALETNFGIINLQDVIDFEASVQVYTTNPQASLHLVTEVVHKPTGNQMEWVSTFVKPGTVKTNTWNAITFRYKIPRHYSKAGFALKTYLWVPDKTTWIADRMEAKVLAVKPEEPPLP